MFTGTVHVELHLPSVLVTCKESSCDLYLAPKLAQLHQNAKVHLPPGLSLRLSLSFVPSAPVLGCMLRFLAPQSWRCVLGRLPQLAGSCSATPQLFVRLSAPYQQHLASLSCF